MAKELDWKGGGGEPDVRELGVTRPADAYTHARTHGHGARHPRMGDLANVICRLG